MFTFPNDTYGNPVGGSHTPGPAYVKLTLRGIVNVANKFLDKMFHHNILSAK